MLISSKLLEIHSFGTDFFSLDPCTQTMELWGNRTAFSRPDPTVQCLLTDTGFPRAVVTITGQEGSQPQRLQARLSGVRNLLMGLMSRGLPGIFA